MNKYSLLILCLTLFSNASMANSVSISCGASKGYSYYFEGGLVDSSRTGFKDDGISKGQFSLILDDKGNADVITKDGTGILKSATSQGGQVQFLPAGNGSANWVIAYGDGVLEIYSYSRASKQATTYRNTVGVLLAKNSLFVSDCDS